MGEKVQGSRKRGRWLDRVNGDTSKKGLSGGGGGGGVYDHATQGGVHHHTSTPHK